MTQTYRDEAYQFELEYPSGWDPLSDSPATGQAPRLLLTKGGAVLEIAYRRAGENRDFPAEFPLTGEAQEYLPAGQISFIDRTLTRYDWRVAENSLAVVYSESPPDGLTLPVVASRDMEFQLLFNTAARSSGLSPELQVEADAILESLRRLP